MTNFLDRIFANKRFKSITKLFADNHDISFSLAIAAVLALMIVPMPSFLIDIFLVINIGISLAVLFVGIYAEEPTKFSSYPTVLLGTTLFRLALNISSTRLVMLHGAEGTSAAGEVIEAFGQFVVGGNYIVGVIVFLIITVINFSVITKGSTRIAEVAARFTLDAMPGKQLSIDADLNAGHITEKQARERRAKLEAQSDFYGSMDGASKFVRGDAVAGIIITIINIIGGIAIGSLQHGLDVMDAMQIYTILTVGDGLVSQIPALIISTSAGILVSRSSKEKTIGANIAQQLLNYPKALAIVACLLVFFAIFPGMPTIPFLLLSVMFGAGAYYIHQKKIEDERLEQQQEKLELQQKVKESETEQVDKVNPLDVLEINVGYELIALVDKSRNGELLDRIKSIRKQFAQDFGIIIPPLHIRDNLSLKPGEYKVYLKNNPIGASELKQSFMLAMDAGGFAGDIDGMRTTEPVFGLPAVWIAPEDQDNAMLNGYTIVDHATIIATHLTELIKAHMHELFGRQDLDLLLGNFKKTYPKVVEELIPDLLPFGTVLKVLQNLLREQIPVRDMLTILECLGDNALYTKDPEMLTEFVRQALARSISTHYTTSKGELQVLTLDREVEDIMSRSIKPSDRGSMLALDPNIAQKLLVQITKRLQTIGGLETQPIILCASTIRGHLKKLTERFIPNLVVLSYGELDSKVKVKSLGVISLYEET